MMIKKNTQEEKDIDTATKLRNTDIDSTNEEIKIHIEIAHRKQREEKRKTNKTFTKFMSNSIVIIVILNDVILLRVDQYVCEVCLDLLALLHNEHHHSVVVLVIRVVHEFSSFVLLIDKLYIIISEHRRHVNRDYHFVLNSYVD